MTDPGNIDPEYLIDCLARRLLKLAQEHGRAWVEQWLGRYGDRHGAAAERRLRDRVNEMRGNDG